MGHLKCGLVSYQRRFSHLLLQYLSPERARGLPHDTRKSDVWSLGVTFFEILFGRTPFEKSDGEQLITQADLEKYWERTLRGKWVGTWDLTKAMEKLLQRMMSPNADLRCTAKQAIVDSYWQTHQKDLSHSKQSELPPRTDPSELKFNCRTCIEFRIILFYRFRKRFRQVI
jgi:serine/threonine protein kinase